MKAIFHIGMGKTGTTSIQASLRRSGEGLGAARAAYLGMWFDMIDPRFRGLRGERLFYAQDRAALAGAADRFADHLAHLHATRGVTTVVFSNETLFVRGPGILDFFRRLGERVELSFLAYLRRPDEWLVSAYHQWGIARHMAATEFRTFADFAPGFLDRYAHIRDWHAAFGDRVIVREHRSDVDVVADAAGALSLPLRPLAARRLQRPVEGVSALKAVANQLGHGGQPIQSLFPILASAGAAEVGTVARLMADLFDHTATPDLVAARKDTFAFIRDRFGLDLVSPSLRSPRALDAADLRDQIIGCLVAIVTDQAARLQRLEAAVSSPDR